jgi:hypothetical protein
MKIDKKLLKSMLLLSAALFIGMTIYVLVQRPIIEGKIVAKQTSKEKTNHYLATIQRELTKNDKALAMLAQTKPVDADIKYSYKATEYLEIISYSKKWNVEKLKQLHEELLRNKHGEEIDYLYQIIVFDKPGINQIASNEYTKREFKYNVRFPALPNDWEISYELVLSIMRLYNGNGNTTIKDFAGSMSHEYGHHFTYYYFFYNEGLRGTEYEKIRKLPQELVRYDWSHGELDYRYNHAWYIVEIAAEDYVQIMGSPLAKKTRTQENDSIPLAREVEGLAEFFLKFIENSK